MTERPYYNFSVLDPNCPSRQLLDLIADKWTAMVIEVLTQGQGSMRYSDIKRRVGGVSHKMLTQTLRKLEEKTLVKRTVYPVVPPHVEYSLTPLGATLIEPLHALVAWAEANQAILMGDGSQATCDPEA